MKDFLYRSWVAFFTKKIGLRGSVQGVFIPVKFPVLM
jgi:hypothetical protein